MKANQIFKLAPVVFAVAGTLALYGCGGGGSSSSSSDTPASTSTLVAPVVNTPLDKVTVTVTCADGSLGGSSTAAEGTVSIVLPTGCLAPFTMAVSGKGTMAGPDLKFGTADDEAYDSTTRTALKSVIQASDLSGALTAGGSVTAPAITALTSLVAEKLGKANPSATEIAAAKTAVAAIAGISVSDLAANPLTNGAAFNAGTLVNEMVAAAIKADPTKKPSDLVKAIASSATAKLSDATVDSAKLMGLDATKDAATIGVMQAEMATMQAKASAMKSVADAINANVASASAAGLVPADAAKALDKALAGSQGADAATMIAKAKMAQDALNQMATQMDALRKDTTVAAGDLSAKITALVQGLEAVRVQQDSTIQTSIAAAGGDRTKIDDALKQASGMIAASAPALLSSVTSAKAADLSSAYMSAAASSIASQIDPAKMAAAIATSGGDASKALESMNLKPTDIASAAKTSATAVSSLKLSAPSALANYPGLGDAVIGMVISRAINKGWLATGKLQDWANAIGTALAKNASSLLNPGSVTAVIGNYFFLSQPDLTTAPGTLTLTIGATTFAQSVDAAGADKTAADAAAKAAADAAARAAADAAAKVGADKVAADAAAKAAADAAAQAKTAAEAAAKAATDAATKAAAEKTEAEAAAAAAAAAQKLQQAGSNTSSLPLCPELMSRTPPVQAQVGVNCRAPA